MLFYRQGHLHRMCLGLQITQQNKRGKHKLLAYCVPCCLLFSYGIEALWSLTEEKGDKKRQRP